MAISNRHFGPGHGTRPSVTRYVMEPLTVIGTIRPNSPFPPVRPIHQPIRHYTPPTSTRIGPIPGIGRPGGGAGAGPHYGLRVDPNVGMRANQAALDRARAADTARTDARNRAAEASRRAAEASRRAGADASRRSMEASRRAAADASRRSAEASRRAAADTSRRAAEASRRASSVFGRRERPEQRRPLPLRQFLHQLFDLGPRLGGVDGIPAVPPRTPNDAPRTITLDGGITRQIDNLWHLMLEQDEGQRNRVNHEFGATIAVDLSNNLVLRNIHMGQPGSVNPDLELLGEPDLKIVGIAHTHPNPREAGFSGTDFANMLNRRDLVNVLVVENRQFLLMRSGGSRQFNSPNALQNAQAARIAELLRLGASQLSALRTTNIEMARQFGLAYYEREGGPFVRVDP
jgi:hypothetical protein